MNIGLLNCGGTITESYRSDGSLDRLQARDLIAMSGSAGWIAHDVESVDSCELNFASLCRIRDVMRDDRDSEGFVLCCGTDAMEDIAYAATLLLDRDRPVVLTGAAIPGGEAGSDGGRNLADSALLVRGMPTGAAPLVAFAGRVFDPVALVKLAPQAVQPFGPDGAVCGTVEAGLVRLTAPAGGTESFADLSPKDLGARVAIVTETFGSVVGFPDPAGLDGLVVAGQGAGGISGETEALLQEAARRIPVVLSTRCAQGFRVNPAIKKYAYDRPRDIGLTVAGYEGLNASKARIRLVAAIGHADKDGASRSGA